MAVAVQDAARADEPTQEGAAWMPVLVWAIIVIGAVPLLFTPMRLMEDTPSTDTYRYANATENLVEGDGYTLDPDSPYFTGTDTTPKYPPGYSIMLAPFAAVGLMHWGPPFIAVALYASVIALAWRLGGRFAGVLAAVAMVSSPFLAANARMYMADAPGALLGVLVVLTSTGRGRGRLAGILAGFAVLVRYSSVFTLIAAVIASPKRKTIALWALPALLILALFQWSATGSPTSSNYEPGSNEFGIEYLWAMDLEGTVNYLAPDAGWWAHPRIGGSHEYAAPHAVLYPAILGGVFWIYAPPLFTLVGLVELWRRRRTEIGRLAGLTVLGNLAIFMPYYYQNERFMAPAALLLVAFGAAGLVRGLGRLSRRQRRIYRTRSQSQPSSPGVVVGPDIPNPI